jgi:hypothetical protein
MQRTQQQQEYPFIFSTRGGGSSSSSRLSASSSSMSDLPYGPPTSTKVLVTGASGRTGQLVFTKLLADPRFTPIALVRSERSAKKLLKLVCNKQQQQCGLDQIVVCDVTKLPKQNNDKGDTIIHQKDDDNNDLAAIPSSALQDCTAMIICTSAVPVLRKRTLLQVFLNIPRNFLLRKPKLLDFSLLRFGWKQDQHPELVDYHGTIAQMDWAKQAGVSQIVLVSSMGGTDPSNFLNRVGKNPDGSGRGDILLWKRQAEQYLVQVNNNTIDQSWCR